MMLLFWTNMMKQLYLPSFVGSFTHFNTLHDNKWMKDKYMDQNDVVVVINHDDNDCTYPLVLVHLPTFTEI